MSESKMRLAEALQALRESLENTSEIILINAQILEFIDYMGLRDDMDAYITDKSDQLGTLYPEWYTKWQAELAQDDENLSAETEIHCLKV